MSVQKLLQLLGIGRSPKRVPVVMRTEHGWDLVFSSPQDVYNRTGYAQPQDWRRILPLALTAVMVLFVATHIPISGTRNAVHSGVLGAQNGPQHVLAPVATPSASPTATATATATPTPTATPAPPAPTHFDVTLVGTYTVNGTTNNTSCQNGSAGNGECEWMVTVNSGNALNIEATWNSTASVELKVILPDGTVKFSQTDAAQSISTFINDLPAKSVVAVIVHDPISTQLKLRLSN